ncbi:acyltransferase [Alphaproteobacteria bacterium]|nr:acyltransferase [Alphaproteobacteria bacterium]
MTQAYSSNLSYRAEIDGLRAIAVVSVILYHAQMVLFGRDWFQGGYIGVDIFFVISGYLITRIILSEFQTKGSFSFLNFYERRARRILPMLFFVVFVSVPFAWQILLPSALVEYAASLLYSVFFGSNFFFYFSTTEYGTDSALLKPFLHTWSLGVEEQFYLIFPFIAIISLKYFRKYILTILLALTLLSLQFAELMEARNSDLNFYLPFSRFWELAAGSMLAYRELNHKSLDDGLGPKILPIIGLYMVVYSILFFDDKTPHPSFYTLIPVLGVALIIGFASQNDLIGKILGSKPFVLVGLISYSAYLWHFPIFAFFRLETDFSMLHKIFCIGLTIGASSLTYLFIEQKFRDRTFIKSSTFFLVLACSTLTIVAGSFFVIFNDGLKQRFPHVVGFENFEIDNELLRQESWELLRTRNQNNPNFRDVERKLLIVGNSHAKDFYNALVQNGYNNSTTDVLRSNLPQIACLKENIEEFQSTRQKFFQSQQYIEATTLIVSTRYSKHRCNKKNELEPKVSDIEGLRDLLKQSKSDGKNIIVLGNTAEFRKVENKWIADFIYGLYEQDTDVSSKMDEVRFEAGQLLWENLTPATDKNGDISALAKEYNVPYFDKSILICYRKRRTCSAITDDGYKTMYDYGHWTLAGAKLFGQRLALNGFDELLQ